MYRNVITIFGLALFLFSCSPSKNINESKINFDLSEFKDNGSRERVKGNIEFIFYEFCIPADDGKLKEVQAIDSTSGVLKGSKGRSGCTDNQWLVIGSSRQPGFKRVILKLASLSYIRKINETFWE
ncbi:MAG TPA: hypothetical protein VGK25_08225 [Ignavibacteria bacterium]|jgi:adenine deaminase